MPINDNPFMPWNSPMYQDDPMAPHNDPTKRDNPMKPWNSPMGDISGLTKEEKKGYGIYNDEEGDDY